MGLRLEEWQIYWENKYVKRIPVSPPHSCPNPSSNIQYFSICFVETIIRPPDELLGISSKLRCFLP